MPLEAVRCYAYRGGADPAPDGPWVVLIHGAGHDHSVWNLQARYLAHHGWSVLAPDLPGHGASGGNAPASVEDAATWLLAQLDDAGITTAALVGHSMGALIALEAAGRAPARISALGLVGCTLPMAVAPALLDAARDDRSEAHRMINRWSFSPRGQLGASAIPGSVPSMVNLRLMERQRAGVLHADLAACAAYQGGLEAAARVRCPTVLICGEQDRMAPPHTAAALRRALAQLRVHGIPECGHAIMSEAPDQLTDALVGMLSDTSPARRETGNT